MSALRNATYDRPWVETYFFPSSAFGATTESHKLIGPKGKKGKVVDIVTDLTADAVGTTTVPEICVGATAGAVEYARYRLGTAAGTGYAAANSPFRATQEALKNRVGANVYPQLQDYAGHVELEKASIPKDTAFFVTRKLGVGGTPAGTGKTWVMVEWS